MHYEFFSWFEKLRMLHCIYRELIGYEFKFFLWRLLLSVLKQNAGTDKVSHYGPFHLGLHCLKYTKGSVSMNIFRRSIISEPLGLM